ncbi:MAG TPA: alpha/beta hydrolase [Solirubrobacteraceae bacterium]|nr:alpha/beta hydrolase [Solirubrobacteraceae bacterium]
MVRAEWTETDWSTHQKWVWVEGRPANVIELGEGPPLVFVHGLSGSWQNWLEQLPVFARTHRVIAMDLPGFGESPMPREKITISGYGRWLDALLDALSIQGATIVGNSMGGFIAAETAIKFPHRVERMVLVSAAGLTIEHQRDDRILRFLEVTENLAQFSMQHLMARSSALVRRPRSRRAMLKIVAKDASKLDPRLAAEQIKGTGKPGFVPALDALTSYPIRDRLSDIKCPTLIVWGEDDFLVPVKDAYEFDRLIPNSRLIVWEDTGHVSMLERPDDFNRELTDFLADQPDTEHDRVAAATAQQAPEPASVEAENV